MKNKNGTIPCSIQATKQKMVSGILIMGNNILLQITEMIIKYYLTKTF